MKYLHSFYHMFFFACVYLLFFSVFRQKRNIMSNEDYCVFLLVNRKRVVFASICLLSFLKFVKAPPQIFILDDGSLSRIDKKILLFIPFVTLYSKLEADAKMQKYEKKYTDLKNARKNTFNRKITDLLLIKDNFQRILILDSDVVFFSKPKELLDFLTGKNRQIKMLYMQDFQEAYFTDLEEIKNAYLSLPVSRLNSGVLALSSEVITEKFITHFFTTYYHKGWAGKIRPLWIEQTAFGLLATKHPSEKLPKTYSLGSQSSKKSIVCGHYTSDIDYKWSSKLKYVSDVIFNW